MRDWCVSQRVFSWGSRTFTCLLPLLAQICSTISKPMCSFYLIQFPQSQNLLWNSGLMIFSRIFSDITLSYINNLIYFHPYLTLPDKKGMRQGKGQYIFVIKLITFTFVSMQAFPIHPLVPRRRYNSDHSAYVQQIEKMYQNYHNCDLTFLEDQILLHDQTEYLKREYEEHEFPHKIAMLSEYYQYHQELPRIFQKEISSIIQIYHEDVRNLEYQLVTRKMKDEHFDPGAFTEREKKKPVEKIIKNIELSYYNFEKKDIKRVKEQDKQKHITNNKNKKSMPTLPLHQYQKSTHPPRPVHKHIPNPMIQSTQALKPKDVNKLSIKCKSKDQFKRGSLNSSIDSPKNLSRSKSKSNLVMAHGDPNLKRNSIKPFSQVVIAPNTKPRSNPTSLQKTSSHKNFLKKEEPKKGLKALQKLQEIKQNNGLKNMFKKVMQTKKVIKIAR